MANLFGIDIAGIIASELASAGNLRPGSFTKSVTASFDPANPTGPPVQTTTTHAFQGFVELGTKRISQERVVQNGNFLTIIGASVPNRVVPEVGDKATLDNFTYEMVELMERDPAAATYIFRVE